MSDNNTEEKTAAEQEGDVQMNWTAVIADMAILMIVMCGIGVLFKMGMMQFERVSPSDNLISLVSKDQFDDYTNEIDTKSAENPDYINMCDDNQVTPLMRVCHVNYNDADEDLKADKLRLRFVQDMLSRAGVDVQAVDKHGFTALHWASWSGMPEVSKALIHAGIDVNQVDNLDNTPLMLAALRGNKEVIALLLENGANLNMKNKLGKTALDRAEEKMLAYAKSSGIIYSMIYSKTRDVGHQDAVALLKGEVAQASAAPIAPIAPIAPAAAAAIR